MYQSNRSNYKRFSEINPHRNHLLVAWLIRLGKEQIKKPVLNFYKIVNNDEGAACRRSITRETEINLIVNKLNLL